LDGTPGPLQVSEAHRDRIEALAVVEDHGAPLIISADTAYRVVRRRPQGALRSWRLDGTPGPLQVSEAHSGSIFALAVVEDRGGPLIISSDAAIRSRRAPGALRSWRLDGTPGPLQVSEAHANPIRALAVVEDHGAPLIISAGSGSPTVSRGSGVLRSWRLDGTPGPLQVSHAHRGSIEALAVVENRGAPLIISAGYDQALRSWRLDGTPGPLQLSDTHVRSKALAVVEDRRGAPLIIGAGGGGLGSWRVGMTPLAALEGSTARELEVRELSLGSLEIVVQLPADVLTMVGVTAAGVTVIKLAKILDAIKRIAGFPAELRLQHTQQQAEQLRAQADLLEADNQLAGAHARHRRRKLQAAGWDIDAVVVTDEDDIAL